MDITGGQLTQTNGNPTFPGSVSTGPYISGNVVHSDGTGTLAGLGGQNGIANQGYLENVQFDQVSQITSSAAGAQTLAIVIPAQSYIVSMFMYITTVWSGGTTTYTITDSAGATYGTALAGSTAGRIAIAPGTTKSVIQQWQNVGNTDVQLVVTSANTGNGLGVLMVEYAQGCNMAKSS